MNNITCYLIAGPALSAFACTVYWGVRGAIVMFAMGLVVDPTYATGLAVDFASRRV